MCFVRWCFKKASPISADLYKWLKYGYGSRQPDYLKRIKRHLNNEGNEWILQDFFFFFFFKDGKGSGGLVYFLTWQIKQWPAKERALCSSLGPHGHILKPMSIMTKQGKNTLLFFFIPNEGRKYWKENHTRKIRDESVFTCKKQKFKVQEPVFSIYSETFLYKNIHLRKCIKNCSLGWAFWVFFNRSI